MQRAAEKLFHGNLLAFRSVPVTKYEIGVAILAEGVADYVHDVVVVAGLWQDMRDDVNAAELWQDMLFVL